MLSISVTDLQRDNNYIIGHDNKVERFKSVGLWWNNEGPW
jgi:hypothetical protein